MKFIRSRLCTKHIFIESFTDERGKYTTLIPRHCIFIIFNRFTTCWISRPPSLEMQSFICHKKSEYTYMRINLERNSQGPPTNKAYTATNSVVYEFKKLKVKLTFCLLSYTLVKFPVSYGGYRNWPVPSNALL